MKETGPEATPPLAFRLRAARAQRREVDANAAALLHGHRALFEGAEDARDRVLDWPHNEAIEQRDMARRSGTGLDAAARQKLETLQHAEEALFPQRGILPLDRCQRARDPTPSVRDAALTHAVGGEPVLCLPNVMGNLVCEVIHGSTRRAPGYV